MNRLVHDRPDTGTAWMAPALRHWPRIQSRLWRGFLLGLVLCTLNACVSIPPKSKVDSPEAAVPTGRVSQLLLANYDQNARNAWIEFNLIQVDSAYYAYERNLQAARSRWNLSTATSALLFNIASSLTPSAGVKANYVAANSLATGANAIVSREEFFEQTVNSLVAAMRARRAEARKVIRIGMSRPVAEYGLSDAYQQLLEYENAGTVTQGMSFVVAATETASKEKVEEARQEIARAVVYSEEEQQLSYCVSESLDIGPATRTSLGQLLASLGVQVDANASRDAMVKALSTARRNAPPTFERTLFDLMQARKLLLTPCPRYQ